MQARQPQQAKVAVKNVSRLSLLPSHSCAHQMELSEVRPRAAFWATKTQNHGTCLPDGAVSLWIDPLHFLLKLFFPFYVKKNLEHVHEVALY